MPRKKLMRLSSAIMDTFHEYNLGFGYSHTQQKHRFYNMDDDLFVCMQGNSFDTIGQGLRWFCENTRYLDRMWYSKCNILQKKYARWRHNK